MRTPPKTRRNRRSFPKAAQLAHLSTRICRGSSPSGTAYPPPYGPASSPSSISSGGASPDVLADLLLALVRPSPPEVGRKGRRLILGIASSHGIRPRQANKRKLFAVRPIAQRLNHQIIHRPGCGHWSLGMRKLKWWAVWMQWSWSSVGLSSIPKSGEARKGPV
jgi:hypothetical protein